MKQVYGVWLPEDDTHFDENMLHPNGDYQRDTFQAAKSYVKEPKIFYDIGAHVGLWSLMAIRAGFKEINAFEPNPKVFKCLSRNLADKEGRYKAHLAEYGVASHGNTMYIKEEAIDNSGAVTLIENGDESSRPIKVSPIWINSIHQYIDKFQLKPHETLVKVDTEGMEADCILGMDKILYALRPVICVEQRTNNDALDILRQMGMQIVQQIRKDYILTWKNQ